MKRESLNTTARQDSLGVAVMGECQLGLDYGHANYGTNRIIGKEWVD